jgi:diguanylate cyclase (GGDEF)-like protein
MIAATIILMAVLSPLFALLALAFAFLSARLFRRGRAFAHEARHDPLTGLPNRRALERHWRELAHPRALLLIDLDGFKAVNDRHGHAVGDALLRAVAARLGATVVAPGLVGRWGGDEFVALVPAARAPVQKELVAQSFVMAHDLSPAGGPAAVHVGGRIGESIGAPRLEVALAAADRALREERASSSPVHAAAAKDAA